MHEGILSHYHVMKWCLIFKINSQTKEKKKRGVEEQVLDEMCPTGTEFWSGEKPESDKVINLTSILLSAKYEPLIIQHCC